MGSEHRFVVRQYGLQMIRNIGELCGSILVQEVSAALHATDRLQEAIEGIALNQASRELAVRVP